MATHPSSCWTRRVASAILVFLQLASPVTSDATTFGPAAFSASTCTKPIVRVEWWVPVTSKPRTERPYANLLAYRRTLSAANRQSYLSAVKCLMNKPPLTPTSDIPGVSNRYEDFVGTHILQQQEIHFVVSLRPSLWCNYINCLRGNSTLGTGS